MVFAYLLFLTLAVGFELYGPEVTGGSRLSRAAILLVFGSHLLEGTTYQPPSLPYLMAVVFMSPAFRQLRPLSRRLLYPISRLDRGRLALRSFLHYLLVGVLTCSGLAAATTWILVLTSGFRPPSGIPEVVVALLWLLALAPFLGCIEYHVGTRTLRSGKVGLLGAMAPSQVGMVLLMGVSLAGLWVSSAALCAVAVPVAVFGWWLLIRRLRAEAAGDLLPA